MVCFHLWTTAHTRCFNQTLSQNHFNRPACGDLLTTLSVFAEPTQAPTLALHLAAVLGPHASLVERTFAWEGPIAQPDPKYEHLHTPITREIFELSERLCPTKLALHFPPDIIGSETGPTLKAGRGC